MNEWILEIYSEEIPARMQQDAQDQAQQLLASLLTQHGALYQTVKSFVAPQRLVLQVEGVEPLTQSSHNTRRGPRLDAPESALVGFAKSTGQTSDQWYSQDGYWYATLHQPGKPMTQIIPELVTLFLDQFIWPKTMRWHNPDTNTLTRPWIRPIRSIACVYNGKPLIFAVPGLNLETGNTTRGHRFLASHEIVVRDFKTYQVDLEKAWVILDHHERQQIIEKQLCEQADKIGIKLQPNPGLLSEVAGLVDYPFVSLGQIQEEFMTLPAAVLSTSMRVHQKYFSFEKHDGQLAPYFGLVTNVPLTPNMLAGYARVLQARLTDAAFFYKVDQETSLDSLVPKLDTIIFHEKLGSVGQKVKRLESLMHTPEGKRAAHLCKADLLTQMVGEFPELQGMMGEIYARLANEEEEICVALHEYYHPLDSGHLVKTSLSIELALADRVDTLVGFIGTGIKPTGSKDPFALRRAALEIAKILMNDKNQPDFDLIPLLQRSAQTYDEQGIILSSSVIQEVIDFINDRIIAVSLNILGMPADVVAAVFANAHLRGHYKIYSLYQRAGGLHELLKEPTGNILKAAYKRASGILDKITDKHHVNLDLLQKSEEKDLYNCVQDLSQLSPALLSAHKYRELMQKLAELRQPIDAFFENVMVNCEDEDLRHNRYALLQLFVEAVDQIADFSQLQG